MKHLKYLAALVLVPLAATGCVEASGAGAKSAPVKTTTTATATTTDDTVTASDIVDVMGAREVNRFCGLYTRLQTLGAGLGYTPDEIDSKAYQSFKGGYGDGGGSGVSAHSVFDELVSRCG